MLVFHLVSDFQLLNFSSLLLQLFLIACLHLLTIARRALLPIGSGSFSILVWCPRGRLVRVVLLVLLKSLLDSLSLDSLHVPATDIAGTSVIGIHELFEFFWQEALLDHFKVRKRAAITSQA